MKKILTVPSVLEKEEVYVSGNHYVSLPRINSDGSIASLNVVRMDTNSLIEFHGEPLLKLNLVMDSKEIHLRFQNYELGFIPTFIYEDEKAILTYQIIAPEKIQGFVIQCKVSAKKDIQVNANLHAKQTSAKRTIFRTYDLDVKVKDFYNSWTHTQVIEYTQSSGIAAIAIHRENQEVFEIKANTTQELYYYVAVAKEADGAALHNMDMQRRTGSVLYQDLKATLKSRYIDTKDQKINDILNVNMNFCYYFSLAKTIDTNEWVMMTSRSDRYYVSGAFWARDMFLWAFPSIVLANPSVAKEMLKLGYQRYFKNRAYHALYLNGDVLYPGFELDEYAAIMIATQKYVEMSKDHSVESEPYFKEAILPYLEGLKPWKHPLIDLYATELDPSDDPMSSQYLCYDNALVLETLKYIKSLGYDVQTESLEKAIKETFVVHHEGQKLFAYNCDEALNVTLYDNPPGSLLLLPYLDLIDSQDIVYQNTLHYYHSSKNPYFYQGNFFGQGCEHSPYPWPKSLCNVLLSNGPIPSYIHCLKEMKYDTMIACETVDPETGIAHTGAAFATSAGFLAYALYHVLRENHENNSNH